MPLCHSLRTGSCTTNNNVKPHSQHFLTSLECKLNRKTIEVMCHNTKETYIKQTNTKRAFVYFKDHARAIFSYHKYC